MSALFAVLIGILSGGNGNPPNPNANPNPNPKPQHIEAPSTTHAFPEQPKK